MTVGWWMWYDTFRVREGFSLNRLQTICNSELPFLFAFNYTTLTIFWQYRLIKTANYTNTVTIFYYILVNFYFSVLYFNNNVAFYLQFFACVRVPAVFLASRQTFQHTPFPFQSARLLRGFFILMFVPVLLLFLSYGKSGELMTNPRRTPDKQWGNKEKTRLSRQWDAAGCISPSVALLLLAGLPCFVGINYKNFA